MRDILAAAQEQAAALRPYGFEAADLAELQGAIEAYAVALRAPREAQAEESSATQSLAELFARLDATLLSLYKLVTP